MTNSKMVSHIVHHQPQVEPKPRALLALLEHHKPQNGLILCYESSECELLARFLARYGYITKVVSEDNAKDLPQIIENLNQKQACFVVCQNNLIDDRVSLAKIPFLVNYDMLDRPQVYERVTQYKLQEDGVDRKIVNLVSNKESSYLNLFKTQLNIEFIVEPLPAMKEVLSLAAMRMLRQLAKEAREVELSQYEDLSLEMLKHEEISLVLSFLIKNHLLQKITTSPIPREPRVERGGLRNRPERTERPERLERRDDRPKRIPYIKDEPPKQELIEEPKAPKEEPIPVLEKITPSDEQTANIYITLGKQDGINDLASLAQFLSKNAKVDLGHFSGGGMVREQSSHIDVDIEVAEQIINAINGQKKTGEDGLITCQIAQPTGSKFTKRPPVRKRISTSSYNRRRTT